MGQTPSSHSNVHYTFGLIAIDKNNKSDSDDTLELYPNQERLLFYPQQYGLTKDNDDSDSEQDERSASPCFRPAKQLMDRVDSGYAADQDTFAPTPHSNRLAQDILYVDQTYYNEKKVESNTNSDAVGTTVLTLDALDDASMLCLSKRFLISLDPNIGLLTSLRKLDLSDNQLSDLPSSIGQLKQLQVLTISRNQLIHLPDTLRYLTRLEELDVSHNQLGSIPSDVAGMKQLVTLDLTHNPLTVLPAEITQLAKLRQLRLDPCDDDTLKPIDMAHDPPSLMEICARNIIRSTPPPLDALPDHLVSYLASAQICSSCHGPYYESHVIRHRWIEKNDVWIPLEYRLCSAHWSDETDRILNMFSNETPSRASDIITTTLHSLARQQHECMAVPGKVNFFKHPQRLQRVMNKNPSLIHKMHFI
ncbi:hypothetical protein BC941DRAFT_432491 [Chlamydoabsidia padenii]|nr:hypothetical protein BC941DRAFT_432491 [Chlamydoabsidia padenii]